MRKLYNSKEEKNAARNARRALKRTSHLKEEWIERVPWSGCWIWTGGTWEGGYGVIRKQVDGRTVSQAAHRYMYELYKEPIPRELDACHTCDNPSCVNPDHIFIGTVSDNMKDAFKKGRRSNVGNNNPNYRHGNYVRDL